MPGIESARTAIDGESATHAATPANIVENIRDFIHSFLSHLTGITQVAPKRFACLFRFRGAFGFAGQSRLAPAIFINRILLFIYPVMD
jgi:hypothetical protein